MPMDEKQSRRRNADIGILTVIPVELEWTRKALEIREDSRQKNRTGRVYFAGEIGCKHANSQNFRTESP